MSEIGVQQAEKEGDRRQHIDCRNGPLLTQSGRNNRVRSNIMRRNLALTSILPEPLPCNGLPPNYPRMGAIAERAGRGHNQPALVTGIVGIVGAARQRRIRMALLLAVSNHA
jgi:hypothetical protein